MTVKAIETTYRGCRFRSRLEARWAVMLDSMRIRWEYEAEGYMINDEPYLPDFRLSAYGVWLEIKGETINYQQREAFAHFGCSVGPIMLAQGSIGEHSMELFAQDLCDSGGGAWNGPCQFCYDSDNGEWLLSVDDGRILRDRVIVDPEWNSLKIGIIYGSERAMPFESSIQHAIQRARSARFEHGEKG